ncbi:MAG: UDP-N-acetylmuramoyl-L-alanine--D-glutamate ligase [Verrucomicrobia bacterium]|nr:UDP-N-acetylmuramoyl-L-alanine--D-glutamate ligase [Verrucomicrobiota bacterium]
MRVSEDIQSWLKKPVAIFGAGVSGKAAAELIESEGGTSIVYDETNTDFPVKFSKAEAKGHKLVIASPGFSADHTWMRAARESGCEIIGELDLSSLLWEGRVVAVTGTNGKTTLVEFITHSLRYAGLDAYAVGNIGYAFASLLQKVNSPDAWAVVEVSSFQAELMRYFKADSIVWSNFSEDHLDRYRTMGKYFFAKARLLDVGKAKTVLIGREVEHHYQLLNQAIPGDTYVVDSSYVRIPANSVFSLKPQRENFQLAAALFRSWGYDPEMLNESVCTFEQSPHRLALVSEVNGIEFWNDSKATNFSAAEAALKHFQQPVFWIGGGRPKGGRIDAFAQRISHRFQKAFLTGDTGEDLGHIFDELQVPWESFDTLENAVKASYDQAFMGAVVLFSPGFASQNPFRNYSERGNCFEKVVSDLMVNLQLTL